jgi:outer membrane lipoprotein SlyB
MRAIPVALRAAFCLVVLTAAAAAQLQYEVTEDEEPDVGPPPRFAELCAQAGCGLGGLAVAGGFGFLANRSAARYLATNGLNLGVVMPAPDTLNWRLGAFNFTFMFASVPSTIAIGIELAGNNRGDPNYAKASAYVGSLLGATAGAGVQSLFPRAKAAASVGYVAGALAGGMLGYNLRRWTENGDRPFGPAPNLPTSTAGDPPGWGELGRTALGAAEGGLAIVIVKYGLEVAEALGARGTVFSTVKAYGTSATLYSYPMFVGGVALLKGQRYYEPVNPVLGAMVGCFAGCVLGGVVGELCGNGDIGAEVGFHVGAVPGAVLGYYWRRLL